MKGLLMTAKVFSALEAHFIEAVFGIAIESPVRFCVAPVNVLVKELIFI